MKDQLTEARTINYGSYGRSVYDDKSGSEDGTPNEHAPSHEGQPEKQPKFAVPNDLFGVKTTPVKANAGLTRPGKGATAAEKLAFRKALQSKMKVESFDAMFSLDEKFCGSDEFRAGMKKAIKIPKKSLKDEKDSAKLDESAYDEHNSGEAMRTGAGIERSSAPREKTVSHVVMHPETNKPVGRYPNTTQGKTQAALHAVKIKGKVRQIAESISNGFKTPPEKGTRVSVDYGQGTKKTGTVIGSDTETSGTKFKTDKGDIHVAHHSLMVKEDINESIKIKPETDGKRDNAELKKNLGKKDPQIKAEKHPVDKHTNGIKCMEGVELFIVKEGFQYHYELISDDEVIKEGISITESGIYSDISRFFGSIKENIVDKESQVDRVKTIITKYTK